VVRFLLAIIFIGAVSGFVGRLLVAGPDPMGFWRTTLLGVAGSFVGGSIGSLLFAGRLVVGPAGLLLGIPGTVIALLIYRKVKFGTIMPPRRR
jgi:uncharacterized membrane protein YeaQ/YmgE (transglycosylase-associated protein family)